MTPHTARRSGATSMIKAGIEKRKVMMLTGHESEESVNRYIDISEDENAEQLMDHPFANHVRVDEGVTNAVRSNLLSFTCIS
jgi:site-specific recombinase XerD